MAPQPVVTVIQQNDCDRHFALRHNSTIIMATIQFCFVWGLEHNQAINQLINHPPRELLVRFILVN